jgi:16S rRNA A1518/A1519 N6-dimethyltransferase RsmA/KsgA/DIM1 with predicted DNA glycosylase/AP lyase activity
MSPNAQEITKRKGSGAGMLTEVFLKNGHRVFGVEPDSGMRATFVRSEVQGNGKVVDRDIAFE